MHIFSVFMVEWHKIVLNQKSLGYEKISWIFHIPTALAVKYTFSMCNYTW